MAGAALIQIKPEASLIQIKEDYGSRSNHDNGRWRRLSATSKPRLQSETERCQMSKDMQHKHDTAGAKAASGKMKRKDFEEELAKLQVELTRLQTWVQATGTRIIVVFEGRDTAGKGGVISRITARTSPRVFHASGSVGASSMHRSRSKMARLNGIAARDDLH